MLIEDVDIPDGRYGQLRFVVSGGYIVVEGEGGATELYASSPSYAALPAGAVVTGSVSLVVDFDVAQSFGKLAGGSGQWVMRPVLQAFVPTRAP